MAAPYRPRAALRPPRRARGSARRTLIPYRQRAEQHAVDGSERGHRGPNAHRERQDQCQRESRVMGQGAGGVAHVLNNDLQCSNAPGVAAVLAGARPIAEATDGGIACIPRCHAGRQVVAREHVHVERDFLGARGALPIVAPAIRQAAPERQERGGDDVHARTLTPPATRA